MGFNSRNIPKVKCNVCIEKRDFGRKVGFNLVPGIWERGNFNSVHGN